MSPADKNIDTSKVSRDDTSVTHSVGAVYSLKAHLRLWLIAVIGFGVDLASKIWAVNTLGDPDTDVPTRLIVIKNYLVLTTIHNTGAVAGIAAGKTTLLLMASVIALVFLFWFFATTRAHQWFTHIGLGLLFAGALGNMYDRIFNNGKVIDFIEVNLHVPFADPWPTFNVADSFLCVGVGILLVSLFFQHKKTANSAAKHAKSTNEM